MLCIQFQFITPGALGFAVTQQRSIYSCVELFITNLHA